MAVTVSIKSNNVFMNPRYQINKKKNMSTK